MDPNLTTLNPITKNQTAHTHFHPPIESGGSAVEGFSPQFSTYDQQNANSSNAEYPSFKKPRTSQTPMHSRMPASFNKPTIGFPFNIEPCLQFRRGRCTYGDNCQFSHVIGNTQKPLPQREELMNKESWDEDQRIIAAMKLCRSFCNGEQCRFGFRCHFLHEGPAKFRKNYATSIGSKGSGGLSRNESEQLKCNTVVQSSFDAIRVSPKPVFWKTRLCNNWEATRNCPFGSYCCFAHGHAELKKFGSHTAMECGSVSTSSMIPTAAMHAPSRTRNGSAYEKKMQGKKCLVKWEGFEKISHIYADWIDDVPLVHKSLSKCGELV